ncbi:MAG: hypothetical protein ACLFTZ_05890 [Acholeplasmataceae bacterium]
MIQKLKKNAIPSLIAGILLIVIGVLIVTVFDDIGESIKNVAIGLMILALIFFLIFPTIQKKRSKLILTLAGIELFIALLVAVMFITSQAGNPSLWLGLIIYTHGVIELVGGYLSRTKQSILRFAVSLILVTVGVYIFASNAITDAMLMDVLLIIFLIPGLFLTVFGAIGLSERTGKTSK